MINSNERPAKGPMVFKSFVACYSFVVILNNFIHLILFRSFHFKKKKNIQKFSFKKKKFKFIQKFSFKKKKKKFYSFEQC